MNYKEKYNEALERAKKINCDGAYANQRTVIGMIFPELAESEDERIRKAIILGIKRCADAGSIFGTIINNEGVKYHDVLAYLEKQKESHYTKRNALFGKCVENCDPKTVEEVNKRVDDIMNMPELSAFEQALTNFIGYWEDDEERWPSQFVKKHGKHILDMAREELQKEQKPVEWNANDKAFIKDCARILDENGYAASAERLLSMFPVKPAEWSEEDEKMRANILNALTPNLVYSCGKGTSTGTSMYRYDKEIAWLKSLRSRPRTSDNWKPSEEQMEALKKVAYNLIGSGTETDIHLVQLYEQLKKLI